jgi:hypothetical protein
MSKHDLFASNAWITLPFWIRKSRTYAVTGITQRRRSILLDDAIHPGEVAVGFQRFVPSHPKVD